ncbi:MAG TPA: 16S rRNA (guanine(966)-N(2))-methyltransferase RsmD [Nevskiaceae bacterium]|nr:16S rRNA (guanine(966)-N(2))-methyltransferase RsmD [Nevskiaceae bacterium]
MRQRAPGTLRIVGGEWRSRLIHFDTACELRPTPDRVRQTLFDWLAPDIAGLRGLDLYAGSGALGFEALSRGAATVTFVERDARQVRRLQEAARALGAEDRARILHGDALGHLASGAPGERYEIAFLDPPYAADALNAALVLLAPRLAAFNRLYLEWPRNRPQALPAGFRLLREKQAGQVSYGLATYSFSGSSQ